MKERPILFSAPMVRALLAGTKTQTRRVESATTSTSENAPAPHDSPTQGSRTSNQPTNTMKTEHHHIHALNVVPKLDYSQGAYRFRIEGTNTKGTPTTVTVLMPWDIAPMLGTAGETQWQEERARRMKEIYALDRCFPPYIVTIPVNMPDLPRISSSTAEPRASNADTKGSTPS